MNLSLRLLLPTLCLLIFNQIEIRAQSTFNVVIKDTVYDHQVMSALELPSGSSILIDTYRLSSDMISSRATKVSSIGEISLQKNFSYEGISSELTSVSQISENEVVFSGSIHDLLIDRLWICITDTSFNVLREKTFLLAGNNLFRSIVIAGSKQDIICYGTVEDTTLWRFHHFFMYRQSTNLDSLQYKIFTDLWGYGLDLIERNDHMGYYAVVLGVNPVGGPGNLVSIDNSLNIRKMVNISHDVTNLGSVAYTDPAHILVTGEYEQPPDYHERDIGTALYDTTLNFIHFAALGKKDTVDCPGLIKNIAAPSANSIAVVGTTNFNFTSMFASQDSWYSLHNIDTTLGLNWQKFYGGDGYYTLYGVLPTQDQGFLMYGTFWDYHHTSDYIRYLSLIKVNKDGYAMSVDHSGSPLAHDVIVYPNPGDDVLYLETQIRNATFTLYDLTGHEVMEQSVVQGRTSLPVGNLKSGIYVYKVSVDAQMMDEGKWIKK
ncbi:MAG: T9SS type A sorting domain-containing protein [Bacteroidota bacterium]